MRLSRISRTMTHIGYNKTEARHPKHKSKEGVQMGASLDAYIEYDDSPMYYQTGEVPPPFTWGTDRLIDLTWNIGIRGAKDYLFIGAIGGPRNPRALEPLFRPRGLPPKVNRRIAAAFSPPDLWTGWLLLPEIEAALAHQNIREEELCFGVQIAFRDHAAARKSSRTGAGTVRL